jgi:DNA-binding beta-propeller fold protein YncE
LEAKEAKTGQLVAPHSIDIDKEGNVYVTVTGNNMIQKYDSDGNYVLKWGEEGSNDGQFM